ALLEPSIKEVVIIDPPKSHREGPTFLNVMRILDIPDALGLLAPRPLTLINAKDIAFDRTVEIYRLAGAADKLKRKGSISSKRTLFFVNHPESGESMKCKEKRSSGWIAKARL